MTTNEAADRLRDYIEASGGLNVEERATATDLLDAALATERRNERARTLARVDSLMPPQENEAWWAPSNGPRIRIVAGIHRRILDELEGEDR